MSKFLKEADAGLIRVHMSIINAGEVFYAVARRRGIAPAHNLREALLASPIDIVPADDDLVWLASQLKSRHAVASADAFVVALALDRNAQIVTGDPDLRDAAGGEGIAVHRVTRA